MKRSAFTLAALLLLAGSASAARRVVLPNGLTVILEPQPTAPSVALDACVLAGRRHEPPSLAGAAHFVEHMVFRATAKRATGEAEREIWRAGGRLRAYTREDYTEYGILVPSDRLDPALDILADLLTGARFLPEEFAEEKAVVLDEIRKRRADPESWAWEELTGLTFLPNAYGARISGTVESILGIPRDALERFYRSRYRPDRTILVVTGDLRPDDALRRIRDAFGGWSARGPRPPDPPPPPAGFGHYQEMVLRREGAHPALFASIVLPGYLHPDYLPTRFLKEILAGWFTQRLVVETGTALSADLFYTQLAERNLLRARITLRRAGDAGRARDDLLGLLAEARLPGFDWSAAPDVAAHMRAREILLREDFFGLARVIGRAAVCGYYTLEGVPEHLAAADRYTRITPEMIARTARAWLVPENLRIVFLLPPGAPSPPLPSSLPAATPRRFPSLPPVVRIPVEAGVPELPRSVDPLTPLSRPTRLEVLPGVTLLHLEHTGLPLVSGAIAVPGGSTEDPPGKEGLAALTLRALTLATEGHEREDIRWRLYTLGNEYRFHTGRDSFLVSFTVPREGLVRALDTLSEMLERPAFTPDAIEEARRGLLRTAGRSRERVSSFAGNAFRRLLLPDSPWTHETCGTPKSLARITPEDVRSFYAAHLRGRDLTVALVGDVPPRRAQAIISRVFAGPPRVRPKRVPGKARPGPAAVRDLKHASGRGYVILGGPAPGLGQAGAPEADVLRLALGYLVFHHFTDVSSNAYEAGAFLDEWRGGGDFGLYVGTSPGNVPEVAEALEKLVTRPIPAEMARDAKSAWLGGTALFVTRTGNVSRWLAFRNGRALSDLIRTVKKTRAEDLTILARRIFSPDHRIEIRVR